MGNPKSRQNDELLISTSQPGFLSREQILQLLDIATTTTVKSETIAMKTKTTTATTTKTSKAGLRK